jgi:hypothetical protein
MSFEETDIEESANSLESGTSEEEVSDDEVDSHSWHEIESESDGDFLEDDGLIEEVTPASEHNTIDPVDCYRHFITGEIHDLMIRETNRYEAWVAQA